MSDGEVSGDGRAFGADRWICAHLGHGLLKGARLLLGGKLLQSHRDEAIKVPAELWGSQGGHFLH